MPVIVGEVIEKDGKYLLVQEARKCRGKWNLPAGHLDIGETLLDAAKREAREESGLETELTGICQIGNRKMEDQVFVTVIFTAKETGGEAVADGDEIMDVKWFSYDEILKLKENDEIRTPDLLVGAINNAKSGAIAPLELINIYAAVPR
ncbi:NUDIX domain-containing protein [Candidatus Saccharibacteria bacterium]|nr:NUDIX domain-containing protein [Candidatus Saccharibacteria bacterium]